MDTLRRMVTGLLLLMMSRSALTVDGVDPQRDFSDPTQDLESNYSKVTCDFEDDTCGWGNVGGDDYPLTWDRKDSYMRLKMNGAENNMGRLASPWLHPLQAHRCRLRFRYYIYKVINKRKKCRLSLYRQARSGEEQRLWFTQSGTGMRRFSDLIYQDVNCTAGSFRMVFEGWKDCKSWFYNEIDVKSIKFTVYPEDARPPTDPTPIEVFTIEQEPTDHGGTTDPPGEGNNHSNGSSSSRSQMDPGLLAAIIVIVVAVVVIVGVLIIVIVPRRRRRRWQRDQKVLVSQHTSGTTTNWTQRLPLQHVAGNGGTDSRGRHLHNTRGDIYEITDLAPPAAVPDDTYDHTSRTGALPPAAMPLEDTYDHTTSRTGALPPAAMPPDDI